MGGELVGLVSWVCKIIISLKGQLCPQIHASRLAWREDSIAWCIQ